MKLTVKSVAAAELPVGRADHVIWDGELAGFGLRLRASTGAKILRSFIVQYRTGGRSRRLLLGSADVLGADQARGAAKKALAEVALGGDPQGAKAAQRRVDDHSLEATAAVYLDHKRTAVRLRTFREIERYLRGPHFRPLHARPLDQITRKDVAACLTRITARNGSVTAGRARAVLAAFCTWAMGEGLAEVNPVIGTNKPAHSPARERVLTGTELAAIWRACLPDSGYGIITKLLVLLGARREEVGGMRWSELDLKAGIWTIPAARAKNHREHELPLPPMALDILAGVERIEGRDHLFGGGADHGFQRWSASKRELDIRSGISDWTIHDLRRTCATQMAEIGILPHIIEAVLNHQSGHKRGPAGVYNRSTYKAEVKTALDRWAAHVETLLTDCDDNVVPMRA
jgi:integrase